MKIVLDSKKEGKAMKKIPQIILGALLLFFIPFSIVHGSNYYNGYVALNVELGYEGYMKVGRNTNAIAEVTATEGFSGTVNVVVPSPEGENYLYEYSISLQDGETGVVEMNFPLFTRNEFLHFNVKDESGRILAEVDKEILRSLDSSEIYIGVLSEDRNISELLMDINLGEYVISSYPYIGTRVIPLNPTDIGDTRHGLDGLDVLILDELGRKTLSAKQNNVVEDWTKQGGILLLELKNNTLQVSNGESVSEIGMDSLDDRDLLYAIIDTAFTPEALERVISKDLYYDGYEEYYTVFNMLNTSIGTELPNLFLYTIVIGLYIVLIGPLLFFFLRKKRATSWTVTILIFLSILFSVIIYVMGNNTRFTEPFIQYATIVNIEDGNSYEETFFNIRAPFNQSFKISIPSSYSLNPIPQRDYYAYSTYGEVEEQNEATKNYNTSLSFHSNLTEVLIEENAPFSPEYFKVEKEISSQNGKKLLVEATYFNNLLSGTVTNQTGMDLQYVTLILGGKAAIIGNLNKGERVAIEDYKIITYSPYYYYDTARRITGLDEEAITNKEGADYSQLLSKTNIIEYFLSKNFSRFSNQANIIAFVKSENYNKFHVNEDYPAYGATLLQSNVEINNIVNGLKYENLTSDSISNVDKEYNYDGISNTTYSGNIRLQYDLGDKENIEELHFVHELTEEDYTYYKPFSGKMYFYNTNTREYDLVSSDKEKFVKEEFLDYLYEENGNDSILVQYIAENMSGEKYTEIQLPSVRLVRRAD